MHCNEYAQPINMSSILKILERNPKKKKKILERIDQCNLRIRFSNEGYQPKVCK